MRGHQEILHLLLSGRPGLHAHGRGGRRDRPGIPFRAYSETSPSSALFRIREKMRRVLSRRDLSVSSALPELLHDRMRGRITSCDEGGVLLVVDGRAIDMGDLARILETHEGWEFELRIRDALE